MANSNKNLIQIYMKMNDKKYLCSGQLDIWLNASKVVKIRLHMTKLSKENYLLNIYLVFTICKEFISQELG